ncbi:MAG: enterotoxin (HBL) [Candidatus Brocadia sinica]|nr:MAG: enterotoxin (HBL) [Candidatus Brocadia sinica]
MPIINTLEIYEDLKSQFKEEEARTLTKALEKSLEEYQKKQESFLATKDDIVKLRGEVKDDITKLREEVKDDITKLREEVKGDIAKLREEVKGDIAKLREEVKGDIAKLRGETKDDINKLWVGTNADINKLRNELANAKAEIIKWLFIFLIGQGVSIIGILKFIK